MELPLHVERLVQSVKALCSSLAAVETPEVTSALNQLPACPCRLQPKVLKVRVSVTPVDSHLWKWRILVCIGLRVGQYVCHKCLTNRTHLKHR